jgi:alpha-amylase
VQYVHTLTSRRADVKLLKNAAVYPFVNDGYPIVYQGQEHGLSGGSDPYNREALWKHGFQTSKTMYHVFARLNHARRRAMRFPPFLTSLLRHHKLDAHTAVIAKPPLVSILTNTGAAAPVRVYYLPSAVTTFAPRMAVVDALSGQIFATDPHGGLSVPIVSGEPRVFLPLGIWEGRQVAWQHSLPANGERERASLKHQKSFGSTSPTHSRGSSLSSMFSWFRGSK